MDIYSISNCRNLRVKIYIIGYKTCGESILFLFVDSLNNNILFSLVVDSYEFANNNKTLELMSQLNLKQNKLDVLCWSHPDADHTKGLLSIIKQYCNEYTLILVPDKLNGFSSDCIDYNKKDKDIVHAIFEYNKKKKQVFTSVSVAYKAKNICKEFKIVDELDALNITINALAPISPLLNDKVQRQISSIHKNDLSIVLDVDVNGAYHFLLCSDVEDNTISAMRQESLLNPVFIKIPHHTSTTSKTMLSAIMHAGLACTTIYSRHDLPEEELLNSYLDISDQVDCTGHKSADNEFNYGYVKYDFDLFANHEVKVYHAGNAYKYY